MDIHFTDARTMIEQKLTRLDLSARIIILQKEKLDLENQVREVFKQICDEKLELIQRMVTIEQEQRSVYSLEREAEVNKLIREISTKDDEIPERCKELFEQIDQINSNIEMYDYQVKKITELIPQRGMATNYTVTNADLLFPEHPT